MTTRTVTGNVKTLTDSAVSSGVVTFEKVVTSTTGNTIHQFGTTTATTDGSGDFSIALAVPASGSYRYRMILPNGDAFYFSIADGASVNVATLIIAETITDSDAIVEALAAYLPLSGGTMTGALTLSGAPTVDLHAATKKYVDDNAGGGAVDSVFGRTGAVVAASGDYSSGQIDDDSQIAGAGTSVSDALGFLSDAVTDLSGTTYTHIGETTDVHGIADTSILLDTSDLGVTVQGYSAKTAAIAALTWAANSIILLTGTATASVQALAAHVITFLQSASAADARTAILAADSRPTQTDIAGTTHTFTTANEGQIVASQSGSATVFTVPLNSAQAFTVGAIVGVERQGAGTLAITATSGVTLNGVDGASKSISTQWAAAALRKVDTNAWVIIGAIS